MKPERQNQVIAEICGWKDIRRPSDDSYHNLATDILGWLMGRVAGIRPGESDHEPLPNYHGSLDACAEMEKTLTGNGNFSGKEEYFIALCKLVGEDEHTRVFLAPTVVCATSAQRCEAFIRLHGKWEEEG